MSDVQLRRHEKFRSKFLRNQRSLVVYLPPGYNEQQQRRFPVLYLHDGQNLFDGSTSFIQGQDWHVGHTTDAEIQAGRVEPLIIVGIYNTGKARIQEYTPTRVPRLGGGRADRYGKFLLEEVHPFMNREYRLEGGPDRTGIGGSSLGGLVSLYLGLSRPDVFGKIAALSPSVWWNQRVIHTFAAGMNVQSRPRIWLDIGTRESAFGKPMICGVKPRIHGRELFLRRPDSVLGTVFEFNVLIVGRVPLQSGWFVTIGESASWLR